MCVTTFKGVSNSSSACPIGNRLCGRAKSVDRVVHKFHVYLSSIVYRRDMDCPHMEENPLG